VPSRILTQGGALPRLPWAGLLHAAGVRNVQTPVHANGVPAWQPIPIPNLCRNLRRQLCRKIVNPKKVATKVAMKFSTRRVHWDRLYL
jgi:hypothetical protein